MNKLIFRRLRRHGGYAALNILGLTIGLTAAFLIFLYVRFERSYDDFHTKAARIYLLNGDEKTPTGLMRQGLTSTTMGAAAAHAFPEIEAVVREQFQPMLVRHGPVVFQFVISIGFIAATFIIHARLNYLRNHPLGFDNRQMLVLNTNGNEHKLALKSEIGHLPGVLSTGLSSSTPGNGALLYALSNMENKNGGMQTGNLNIYLVDFDYMRQYKLSLVAGRDFSTSFATDSTQAMIINESAAKDLGYANPQEAIGRRFDSFGRKGRIIGVIKDFNYLSLHDAISPLGLLGLASYSTLQRTREIGIRKVLGASVAGIVRLLSGEFLRLVAIALVIATPLCWFFMHRWLADYYYRIGFPWRTLVGAGGLALMIAFLTIGFQTIKAAVANPVRSLKTE